MLYHKVTPILAMISSQYIYCTYFLETCMMNRYCIFLVILIEIVITVEITIGVVKDERDLSTAHLILNDSLSTHNSTQLDKSLFAEVFNNQSLRKRHIRAPYSGQRNTDSTPQWILNIPSVDWKLKVSAGKTYDYNPSEYAVIIDGMLPLVSPKTDGEDIDAAEHYFWGVVQGSVIECGALSGTSLTGSQSYLFEKRFNWRRVLIEANPVYRSELKRHPHALSVNAVMCNGHHPVHYVVSHENPYVSGVVEYMSSSFLKTFHPDIFHAATRPTSLPVSVKETPPPPPPPHSYPPQHTQTQAQNWMYPHPPPLLSSSWSAPVSLPSSTMRGEREGGRAMQPVSVPVTHSWSTSHLAGGGGGGGTISGAGELRRELHYLAGERGKTQDAYDQHASWLDGLRKEIGRFHHGTGVGNIGGVGGLILSGPQLTESPIKERERQLSNDIYEV
mmetsp:Transcript_30849/g.31394  ORF Transcript_30849/g.31394 Transcript_30849/m.31394 type:complete len:446 (+) Transcript_30849:85-1422(+)